MEQFLQYEESSFDHVSDAVLDAMERVRHSIENNDTDGGGGPNSFFEWLAAAKEMSSSRAIVKVIFVRDTIFTPVHVVNVKHMSNIILVSINSETHWQSLVQSFASTGVLFTCAFFSEKVYVDVDTKTFHITVSRRRIE